MKESSRVIVKNLPKAITEQRLRDHFEKKGFQVTDCRIQKTQNGQSRLKSEEQAGEVIKSLNKTFIETAKVSIEYAQAKESSDISRAWSKHTPGSSAYSRANPEEVEKSEKKKVKSEAKAKAEVDAKLEEFLGVALKKKGARVWANDEVANESETFQRDNQVAAEVGRRKAAEAEKLGTKSGKKKARDSDDEEGMDEVVFSDDDDDVNDLDLDGDGGDDVAEANGMKKLSFDSDSEDESATKPKASNKKQPAKPAATEKASKSEDEDEEGEDGEEDEGSSPTKKSHAVSSSKATNDAVAADTGRLRVVNLPYSATAEELKEFFVKKFGPVEETHVSKHEVTGVSRGFGFVQFIFAEHAVKALSTFYSDRGCVFQGRKIGLEAAAEKKTSKVEGLKAVGGIPLREKQEATSSYKRQQELKKKAQAGNARSWNLLYVSANGVADAVAEQLGVDKSTLLDLDSEGLAVRVALGEAQLLRDTKDWLKAEGIRVDAFERRGTSLQASSDADLTKARALDTLILKHLPPKVTDEDLRALIAPCGAYSRLCVAPSRTVAIVQFAEAQRASNAFKALAFKRFLGVPLYVEWAPVDLFTLTGTNPTSIAQAADSAPATSAAAPATKAAAPSDTAKTAAADIEGPTDGAGDKAVQLEEEMDVMPTVSLFVKNLNFRTSDQAFSRFFNKLKGFKSAKIMTKAAPIGSNMPVDVLSLGYGFVEFDCLANLKECMKMYQGAALDGHALELSIAANRNAAAAKEKAKDRELNTQGAGSSASHVDNARVGTRLLVKNLAFQSSKRDLTKLFAPYGTIASVRLPKKADGTLRGFGFVEMASRADAKNALEMLQHAHLYGRHLVIEPAKEDDPSDGADAAQMKAVTDMNKAAGDGPQNESRKRRRLAALDEVDGGSMERMMDM